MIDLLSVIHSYIKLDGLSKERDMIKRYDMFINKWLMGYWVGTSFKIVAVFDN